MQKAAPVVGEVLHPDSGLGADHADCTHQRAAHFVGLCADDVLDPDLHRGFGPVAALALFGELLAALALAVDLAGQHRGA